MKFILPAFVVEATRWATAEDLMRICNGVNVRFKLATLSLHENANNGVTASGRPLLAPPDTMPDETLLRAITYLTK
jgi:hypothetical protein